MTEPKKGWFQRLADGLSRSSKSMTEQVAATFTKQPLTQAKLDELEEMLIEADLGPHSAARITQRFSDAKFGKSVDEQEIKEALAEARARPPPWARSPTTSPAGAPRCWWWPGTPSAPPPSSS
jgi:fused signal recognition particle receptor